MREYFLPTIRLTTWTCLIVGWKCWPFCTRTIIGRKQGYKMREYVLPENSERKFGWKSVSILYHFFRTISSGIKKVAQKAQKNCFPLLRSGTKKYIICPNDDQQLWTSQLYTTLSSLQFVVICKVMAKHFQNSRFYLQVPRFNKLFMHLHNAFSKFRLQVQQNLAHIIFKITGHASPAKLKY